MAKKAPDLAEQIKTLRRELAIQHLRGFEAAKLSRRTEHWAVSNLGPNADLRQSLQRIIARHQDLVDSNPWAAKAIAVIVANWVGDGIIGKPINASKKYADGWREWSESTACDFDGLGNLYAKQALIARTVAVRGSCLVRQHFDERLAAQGLVPLRIQVMEPDYLDFSKDDGARIRFGKQYDSRGQLEGYWIRRSHPGESDWTAASLAASDFVPANEICHVYDVRRPGQATGVPFGVAALLTLRDIADRDAAQLMRDKLSACFMAFLEESDPESLGTGAQEILDTLEPGAIEILPPGKNIRFSEPPAAGDYVSTQRYHLQAVAQAYEISFESLSGDFSQVNFSSGRMGWQEMRRAVARWRWSIMIPQFLDPLARWYREAAGGAGMAARGTSRFEWTPPITWLTDPAREIPAYVEAVKAGFMSLSEIQRMLGYVPELVIQELGQDMAGARAAGLTLSTDAKAAAPPSAPAAGGPSANLGNIENQAENPAQQ